MSDDDFLSHEEEMARNKEIHLEKIREEVEKECEKFEQDSIKMKEAYKKEREESEKRRKEKEESYIPLDPKLMSRDIQEIKNFIEKQRKLIDEYQSILNNVYYKLPDFRIEGNTNYIELRDSIHRIKIDLEEIIEDLEILENDINENEYLELIEERISEEK